jgi:hypothetical protein
MRVLISSTTSFWLSREAVLRARELDAAWAFPDSIVLRGEPDSLDEGEREEVYSLDGAVPRHDPILLRVYDELGGDSMAGFERSRIDCVEIPDDVTYFIESYIGEWVSEQHRVWSPSSNPEGRLAGGHCVFTRESVFSPRHS